MVKTECSHRILSDRYAFDFDECSLDKGYAQFDTREDASYYGQWVNPHTLEFISYVEGDVTRQTCDTQDEFAELVRKAVDFHGDRFLGIDPGFDDHLKDRFETLGIGDLLH